MILEVLIHWFLDEADKILDMGFKQDLNRILKYTKGNCKIWLFSAAMPEKIQRIIKTYMDSNAKQMEIEKNALVNSNISHQFVRTSIKEKTNAIVQFLEKQGGERGIIFYRTKAGSQNLAKQLKEEGFSVAALEGDMEQKERDKVMKAFKNESIQFLIPTGVSAGGIDVRDVSFVIRQLPEKMDYYVHRSGRTSRAGKIGLAIAFV